MYLWSQQEAGLDKNTYAWQLRRNKDNNNNSYNNN